MRNDTSHRTDRRYVTFDLAFERFRYPAGESHLRLRGDIDVATVEVIEAEIRDFDHLGQLLTADRLLRRLGRTITWFVPYFPFARHDRRNDRLDGFELEVALDMARDVDLVIADPHSDVAGMLRHIGQDDVVEVFRTEGVFDDDPIVVIPDAGATKKAYGWVSGSTAVQAAKRRDPATGRLSGFAVDTTHLPNGLDGRPCLVVDDICDGGATFLGLAAELVAAGAGPLTLAVTHGLFTRGLDALAERFDRIVTFARTDIRPSAHPTLQTINFRVLYEKGTVR